MHLSHKNTSLFKKVGKTQEIHVKEKANCWLIVDVKLILRRGTIYSWF
jgi:hypothetical protein